MNRTLDKLFAQGGRSQTDTKTRWMSRRITEREYQDFRRNLAFLADGMCSEKASRAGELMLAAIDKRKQEDLT